MSLLDTSLVSRAYAPMYTHQSRSLCNYGRVLRRCLVPPDAETVGGGIQIRMGLPVVQPFARSEELTALWVQLLV
jgi:hypothetical protein